MFAAVYTQGKGFDVLDVPLPQAGDDELLVRVKASSICGTDLRIIKSGQRKLNEGDSVVLGHEFTGVVEQAGEKVAAQFPVGSRLGVAPNIGCGSCPMCARALPNMCPNYSAYGINIDGAHTELVVIRHDSIAQGSVMKLPEGLPFYRASLIEPLSCAVHGVRTTRMEMGERVLIFGAGPIGLLHVQLSRLNGAGMVIAADLQADRLKTARSCGADVVVNSREQDVREEVMRLTDGDGVDVIITACSVPEIQEQSIDLLAPFGRVCFFGGLPKDRPHITIDSNAVHYKSLVVTGMTGGSPHDYRTALDLIASGRIDVEPLISHRCARGDMREAFDIALDGKEASKIVIEESAEAELAERDHEKAAAALNKH
jgi:2-desacetyl-2-hydroxyethyl bacteriochlorophyllide A dehydrogenase